MNAWPFVITAYALTLGASAAIAAVAYRAMRRLERAVDKSRRP